MARMNKLTAVAHRGDPYRVRENTLGSIRSAVARGADAVEVDVRLTRDGVPVLLHDDTLKRLWGHDRALASLTAVEVKELTEGGVPTLEEALRAAEDTRLMLDLPGGPGPAAVRGIVGVVRDAGARDRVCYTAGPQAMLAVRAADPDAEIALTWTSVAPPRPAVLDAVRPRWLNYRFGLLDADLVEWVHRQGCLVHAWTPDLARSIRRVLATGADGVTTNRIDVLCRVRERWEAAS